MRIFWKEKNCKNRFSFGLPFASGGWTPRYYSCLILQVCQVYFLC